MRRSVPFVIALAALCACAAAKPLPTVDCNPRQKQLFLEALDLTQLDPTMTYGPSEVIIVRRRALALACR